MLNNSILRTDRDNEPDDDGRSMATSTGAALVAFVGTWSAGVDPSGLDAGGAVALTRSMHQARDLLDGVLVRVADRARTLERTGTGPPAEETMTGDGRARALTGRDLAWASEVTASFPELGRVVRAGSASREAVAAVARLWWRLDAEERAELVERFDAELAARLESLPPDAFISLVQRRGRAVRNDDGREQAEADERANTVDRRRSDSGRYRYTLDVDPITDEMLWSTIEARGWMTLNAHREVDSRRSLDRELRAEAMTDLIRAGAADERRGLPRSVAVNIVVDHQTLLERRPHADTVCETHRGTPLPLGHLHRYACDAVADTTHLDGNGRPFDHGRTRRSASPRQKRALRSRYGGCAITGTPFVDCEIHHLVFWEDGGRTDLDNLVPLSRRWHHLIHDLGWRLARNSGGGLDLHRPDGALHRSIPAPTPITRRHPVAA